MIKGGKPSKVMFSGVNEYRGTEYFTTVYRSLELRLGEILEQWVGTDDTDEALRLQGAAREIRVMLKILTPELTAKRVQDTTSPIIM